MALALSLSLETVQLHAADFSSPPETASQGKALLQHKLDSIIIDKVEFDKLDIATVVQFLQAKSRELDPEKEGVNFVLRLPPAGGAPSETQNPIHREVSMSLENVPLAEILRYVAQQTNLVYSVEDHAVYLQPADEVEALVIRTFAVPPGFFTVPATAASPETASVDVQGQLAGRGILFPPGAAAVFLPASNKLVMRDVSAQVDLVAALLNPQGAPSPAGANPVITVQEPPTPGSPVPTTNPTGSNLDGKLKTIVLSVDFNNATLEEATNFLSVESKRIDPEHRGVQFVILAEASQSAKPISVTLTNVPLGEALHYVCQLADVRFKVGDNAITILR